MFGDNPAVTANPASRLVAAVRLLMAGGWPGDELTWVLVAGGRFVAVFGSLTMRLYHRRRAAHPLPGERQR